jgi:translation initiation factor 2 subunit 1
MEGSADVQAGQQAEATGAPLSDIARRVGKCRMYEAEYPDIDDLVMVRVNRINEIGAFVSLLEYNDKEGIILLSELSRRRMRSINKHIRVGKKEVLQVLRVDKEKGYIDLSKKLLKEEDIVECTQRYQKSKTVHSIMTHVAELQTGDNILTLEELYRRIGWPLYETYGHAYDAFKKAAAGEDIFEGLDAPAEIKDNILKTIQHRLGSQPVKIQADIQVTCFSYEGIDAIKPALRAGLTCGTTDSPIRIQLVTSPEYILLTSSTDHERGIALLKKSIEAIQTEIKKHGGDCVIKTEPRVVA